MLRIRRSFLRNADAVLVGCKKVSSSSVSCCVVVGGGMLLHERGSIIIRKRTMRFPPARSTATTTQRPPPAPPPRADNTYLRVIDAPYLSPRCWCCCAFPSPPSRSSVVASLCYGRYLCSTMLVGGD